MGNSAKSVSRAAAGRMRFALVVLWAASLLLHSSSSSVLAFVLPHPSSLCHGAAFIKRGLVDENDYISGRNKNNGGLDSGLAQRRHKSRYSLLRETPSFLLPASSAPEKKDVVIIGGGLAGLSAALYLSHISDDAHITVLDREQASKNKKKKSTVASLAAAGMLAPNSERLPQGPLLELCLQSRALYSDFCQWVESLAQDESVQEYLNDNDESSHTADTTSLPPWSVGFVASGGFLAPAFAGDAVATWAPPTTSSSQSSKWLDATQVHELEPQLHPDVIGGWWFPEDASVDARRLTCSLRAACVAAGVQLEQGVEVTSLDLQNGKCQGVWCRRQQNDTSTSAQYYYKTRQVLVANGAWMRQLLPVPLEPHKGQSLSLRMPPHRPALLRRVLFAQDCYIVPKADGRLVVGATVEAGSYDNHVTPAGLLHILSYAVELVPGLADLPLEETWVGLRPTTPDKAPILGKTPWDNLFLAGGYWRNGVLLAPKTGQLIAALMSGQPLSDSDQELLDAFAWDRFTSPEGGAKLAANARYAAAMHPIQRRTSGAGVAAAVGTELGSYSTARTASQERQKDREALFETKNEDSLERAAMLGKQDGGAFAYGDETKRETEPTAAPEVESDTSLLEESNSSLQESTTTPYEGSADALTVSSSPVDEEENLQSVYESIRQNQQSRTVELMESSKEERPDPGFRIYHLDSETGVSREVPPYTTPEEMERIVAQAKLTGVETTSVVAAPSANEEKGDSIFDGYQVIQDANDGISDEKSAKAMQEMRKRNRGESEPLHSLGDVKRDSPDVSVAQSSLESDSSFQSENPALKMLYLARDLRKHNRGESELLHSLGEDKRDSIDLSVAQSSLESDSRFESGDPALNMLYQQIRDQKSATTVEMGERTPEERPDPGFRIYHLDAETGESREVPPYTTPEEMERMVAQEKAARQVNGSRSVNGAPEASQGIVLRSEHGGTNGTDEEEYSEQTYDGYQAIQQANARGTREEELEAMRVARRQNRESEEVDVSQIGAQHKE